jgi:hypothetical protein
VVRAGQELTATQALYPNPKCKICKDPVFRKAVDAKLVAGLAILAIGRQMRDAGYPTTSQPMIWRHQQHAKPFLQKAREDSTRKSKDLAIVVRDKVLEAVEDGSLSVTDRNWKNVTPGLQAQNLLDKREARVDDRKTADLLARLLYGAPGVIVMPPERLLIADGSDIEGEFVEVT